MTRFFVPDIAYEIEQSLEALQATYLKVQNFSHAHHGHVAVKKEHAENNYQTHFSIRISSPYFAGKSLVEQHKLIHNHIGKVLLKKIHALQIESSVEPLS